MPYEKQPWNQYDKTKTIEQNVGNDAVVTPAKMNHIEDGIKLVEQENNGRIEKFENDYAVLATNKIINGDLSKGLTSNYTTIPTNKMTLENGRIKVQQTTADSYIRVATPSMKIGNTYYIAYDFIPFRTHFPTVYQVATSNKLAVKDVINRPSFIHKATAVLPSIALYTNGATLLDVTPEVASYFDNFLMIDLTETFGVGNEPTQAQMDRLLTQFPNSWFDGTKNLFLARWALNELFRQDRDKANVNQEDWITPTLINGAVTDASFPIMFRKTSLGQIVFTGRYKPAPAGSYSLVLPTGYTPKSTTRFVTGTNAVNINSTVQLQTSGRVYLEFPTNPEWVDFSIISYQGAN